MIRITLAAALSLAPIAGLAQSNDDSGIELFVTEGDAPVPEETAPEIATDPLALCLARPGSPCLSGAHTGRGWRSGIYGHCRRRGTTGTVGL